MHRPRLAERDDYVTESSIPAAGTSAPILNLPSPRRGRGVGGGGAARRSAAPSVRRPRRAPSATLPLLSSILHPPCSIFYLLSSIFYPLSSILYPRRPARVARHKNPRRR